MATDMDRPRQAGHTMSRQRVSSPRQRVLTLRSMFIAATILLLLLTVVIPNSLQITTGAALVICFLLGLRGFKIVGGSKAVFMIYVCTAMVTLLYIAVGFLNGAPWIAVIQVLAIYIVSPFLWIVIATALYTQVRAERLVDWFAWLGVLCCISVAIYFVLYQIGGTDAVKFFVDSGNVDMRNGYSGAVMHVYGSLIFLCGGFFSSPELIRSKLLRMLLLASLLLCAITSGRSALILAIPIGLLLGLLLTPRTVGHVRRHSFLTQFIRYGVLMLLAIVIAIFVLGELGSVDLAVVLGSFIDKLATGGGAAREGQAHALLQGIINSGGIGVGHGIGVSYIRSYDYPWRYELVWLATVLRVGIAGALVYAAMFIWYIARVGRVTIARRLTPSAKFMFCGFIAAFVASNTNPYIEAFTFQWMYVIPVVGFFVEYSSGRTVAFE